VGALLALLATGQDFTIIALIGVILLIGIVKKNAIMMIDFALQIERERDCSAREAIYEACLLRLRPILMTTMAAMFGALPLAIGTGDGAELRRPLGIAVVGGLLLSQLLTLYTTPVMYVYLDRFRLWANPACSASRTRLGLRARADRARCAGLSRGLREQRSPAARCAARPAPRHSRHCGGLPVPVGRPGLSPPEPRSAGKLPGGQGLEAGRAAGHEAARNWWTSTMTRTSMPSCARWRCPIRTCASQRHATTRRWRCSATRARATSPPSPPMSPPRAARTR